MPSSPRSEPKLTAKSSTVLLHRAIDDPLDLAGVLLQHEDVVVAEERHRGRQGQTGGDRAHIETSVQHDRRSSD